MPVLHLIGGINGAGKTTFFEDYLPNEGHCLEFLNADMIAKGLSPFQPEKVSFKAGRLLLERLSELAAAKESFALESTLSGLSYLKTLKQLKSEGYYLKLYYLWIPNAETAQARVRRRVSLGGHHIPDDVVSRRYQKSLNFFWNQYRLIVDEWRLFDNRSLPRSIVAKGNGEKIEVVQKQLFEKIKLDMKDSVKEESMAYDVKRDFPTGDEWTKGIEQALKRGDEKLLEESRRTGVPLIFAQDGYIGEYYADRDEFVPLKREDGSLMTY
ncbi:MAG: AAA family ATPase [Verrucomicrobiota bacterium]